MIELRKNIGLAKTMDDMADEVGKGNGKNYFNEFRALIASFIKVETTLMAKRQSSAESTTQNTYYTLIFGVLIAVILTMIISTYIGKTITYQFQKILRKITTNASHVANASDEMAQTSRSLSSNSMQQASAVEETSSSMEEISGIVQNNVGLAKESSELSESVNSQMVELAIAMDKIAESNVQIDTLVEIINEIGAKTTVIDEIVFQTKLLSFNASVEAERAGEHGRGFAVVAQEVGNLAQMSGKAAMEISTIVKESTAKATGIVKENSTRVKDGTRIAKDTLRQSESVTSKAKQIAQASTEQSRGISQISLAIENINNASQKTTGIAENSSSSSTKLNQRAISLNNLVSQLNLFLMGQSSAAIQHHQVQHQDVESNEFQSKVVPITSAHVTTPSGHIESALKIAVGGGTVPPSNSDDEGSWEDL
jgi:methyl-accepting chemotaxis protein